MKHTKLKCIGPVDIPQEEFLAALQVGEGRSEVCGRARLHNLRKKSNPSEACGRARLHNLRKNSTPR